MTYLVGWVVLLCALAVALEWALPPTKKEDRPVPATVLIASWAVTVFGFFASLIWYPWNKYQERQASKRSE
jgi:hypothetical protein